VKTSGSVLSAFDPAAHFGLGDHSGPVAVTVAWPGGQAREYAVDRLNRQLVLTPDGGVEEAGPSPPP
jgi:hypothetical protein